MVHNPDGAGYVLPKLVRIALISVVVAILKISLRNRVGLGHRRCRNGEEGCGHNASQQCEEGLVLLHGSPLSEAGLPPQIEFNTLI